MPDLIIKHPNPNFIINQVKGWNSRVLYTYYGAPGWTPLDIYNAYDDVTNIFYAIENYNSSNSVILSKGQYQYPQYSRFFKTGKSIRVKGSLLVSSTSDPIFNISAKIYNGTNSSLLTIAAQNNGSNHIFAQNSSYYNVPVNFEITYNCVETDNKGAPSLWFQANGFYQYDFGSYNNGGANNNVIYVPIWNYTNSTQWIGVGDSNDAYDIYISFDGSANLGNPGIILRHLTVEELS